MKKMISYDLNELKSEEVGIYLNDYYVIEKEDFDDEENEENRKVIEEICELFDIDYNSVDEYLGFEEVSILKVDDRYYCFIENYRDGSYKNW